MRDVNHSRLLFLAAGLLLPATCAAQDSDTTCLPRIEISVSARRLWVIRGDSDTVYTAPVAVGSGRTLRTAERTWRFVTPLGTTTVVAKEKEPFWIPPDWHYVEVARERRLQVTRLVPGDSVRLSRNRVLVVSGQTVGVLSTDSVFTALPPGAEIVFDKTVFIPPLGTDQRRMPGILGPYRLRLANGVGLHGTPYKESIGRATTHGCIRLHDADITWLYENIAVGTTVVIRK